MLKQTDRHIEMLIHRGIDEDTLRIVIDPATARALEKSMRVLNQFVSEFDNSRVGEFLNRLREVCAHL